MSPSIQASIQTSPSSIETFDAKTKRNESGSRNNVRIDIRTITWLRRLRVMRLADRTGQENDGWRANCTAEKEPQSVNEALILPFHSGRQEYHSAQLRKSWERRITPTKVDRSQLLGSTSRLSWYACSCQVKQQAGKDASWSEACKWDRSWF